MIRVYLYVQDVYALSVTVPEVFANKRFNRTIQYDRRMRIASFGIDANLAGRV